MRFCSSSEYVRSTSHVRIVSVVIAWGLHSPTDETKVSRIMSRLTPPTVAATEVTTRFSPIYSYSGRLSGRGSPSGDSFSYRAHVWFTSYVGCLLTDISVPSSSHCYRRSAISVGDARRNDSRLATNAKARTARGSGYRYRGDWHRVDARSAQRDPPHGSFFSYSSTVAASPSSSTHSLIFFNREWAEQRR